MEKYVLKTETDGSEITVRDLQLVLLDMLKNIDSLCRKNSIPFWLNGGSALGAVRHKGFIPWDDDADIAMMRSDYERFVEVMKTQCPQGYVFQCFDTDDRYNVLIPAMKIRCKGTYIQEVNKLLDNRCKGYEGCDGVFIDVFVYDYMTPNKLRDLPPRILNQILMVPEIFVDNVLHRNPKRIKQMIMKNTRRYGDRCREEKSDYVGFDLTWVWKNPFRPFIFRYNDIFPVQYVDFEDTKLPIAHHPHEFLRMGIAPSYMQLPPEGKRFAKHTVDIRLKDE